MRVLTITQINMFIKSLIEGDGRLNDIYAAGEISNFTDHYRSGHLYFSLKDEKSVLKAVMFHSAARRLRFQPRDGMRVIVRGRVSVYEPSGQYQFYVEEMQPDGLGALSLAFVQLKEKLTKEGLFNAEYKKPIPRFPERVGIITSPTGAAVRDMLQILGRRWPAAALVFCPVLVQGDGAPAQLTAAVQAMNRLRCADVILIGRGGGSAEDLAAFNDETLARAIFASEIPVISAVGHETDFTICDFVADLRAPTPSAAAELAVPDRGEIAAQVDTLVHRIQNALQSGMDSRRQTLDAVSASAVLRDPAVLVNPRRMQLDQAVRALKVAEERLWMHERERLSTLCAQLDGMSPLKVMARGYAALSDMGGHPVRSVRDVEKGAGVRAHLADGTLLLRVEAAQEERGKYGEEKTEL